jgi:hypothetical protein
MAFAVFAAVVVLVVAAAGGPGSKVVSASCEQSRTVCAPLASRPRRTRITSFSPAWSFAFMVART